MKINVSNNETSEVLDVDEVSDDAKELEDGGPHEVGDEFWVIEGIDSRETRLIPSEYTWLSGSMADPRVDDGPSFPLVYVPKDGELTVKVVYDD